MDRNRISRLRLGIPLVLALVTVVAGEAGAEEDAALRLTSPAFGDGQSIPARFTCEGMDLSPPLRWNGVPRNARSLALIVDDPDAPDPRAPKITWVHWVVYNIPVAAAGLPEHTQAGNLPEGTEEGVNSWHRTGYGGPCPPIGRHRYFFKLYALDTVLAGTRSLSKDELVAAMKDHVVARDELIGTYRKIR